VAHFLQKINWELGTDIFSLEKGVLDRLTAHTWPGNVRELENVLVEAVVRARGKVILVDEIENILLSNYPITTTRLTTYSLPHMEKEHIRTTLDRLDWNRSETARVLGISQPTLRKKIRKYGIVPSVR